MELSALGLAIAGFAALALAMRQHHRDLFGKPPSVKRAAALRGAGGIGLILSLALCVICADGPVGLVSWFGLLTVAGLAVALWLTYRSATKQQTRATFPSPARADAAGKPRRRGPSASQCRL